MTETLTHYPAGADVPDWLVAVEPATPGAVFESLKFMAPAIVADLPDRYLVFSPDMSTPPPSLHIIGGANRVYAAAKPVHFIIAGASFWTLDTNAWTPVAEMASQGLQVRPKWAAEQLAQAQAAQREAMVQELDQQAQAMLQRHNSEGGRLWGLWRRLWAAFKG